MPKIAGRPRAILKDRVRRVSIRLIARGFVPSARLLNDHIPERDSTFLMQLRDELRRDGKIPSWEHLRSHNANNVGLYRSEATRRQLEDAIAVVRREKIARGERMLARWTEAEDGTIADVRTYRFLGRPEDRRR